MVSPAKRQSTIDDISILIVTPTYNERDNVEEFIQATLKILPRAHILIVDDASPDGTGALADKLSKDDSRISVLHRKGKLGLGTAYVDGFRWGLDRGFQLFFEMDTDLSHDPKYLPSFLREFDLGADVVVGSRNIRGGGVEGWGLGRHVLSRGGSIYARTILGVGVRDLTTGYKGYTRDALFRINIDTIHSNGYSFQVETTYRALRQGLDVREVPIVFVDRRCGQSKMSRRIFAEAVVMIWKLRLDALRGRL